MLYDGVFMEFIIFVIVVVLVLMIQFYTMQVRQKRQLKERLLEQWGQVPEREYADGDLRRIGRYYELCHKKEPEKLVVDDITWNDLELEDLFLLLNHTQSSVGEESLYRMLRMPETDLSVLQERDRLAEVFTRDADLRLALETNFSHMGRDGRQAVCDYISELSKQPRRTNVYHYLVIAVMLFAVALLFVSPFYGGLILSGAVCGQIVSYYQQKARVESFFVCVSNVVRLARCGQEICRMSGAEEIESYREILRSTTKEIEPILRKAKAIAAGKSMSGSPLDLLADYIKMLLHTDLIAYNQILGLFREVEPAVWQTIDTLGQLECGLAIASFRQCMEQWCKPEFSSDGLFLHGKDLYHPLIDRAVPNDVQADRSQLITGSNASGKSTYLKTVALSAALAQTICTVPGTRYHAPFYQIYSSMALKDNLVGGESYYMVEIRSLKRILDRGEDKLPVLCFVDEVLRGTNTVERIAASAQILKSMTEKNILCFAATHDGELTYLLEEWFDNGHFSETITEGDILFSYRLQPGRAVGRNALQLLGLMGYDQQVLLQAKEMAAYFDKTGIWSVKHEG